MADKVQFELVTPTRLLMAEAADMVVVPGADGNFGVLPGHAPLLSTLRPGVIDVYELDTVAERIFVTGGFAEVTPERFTVLAEEAVAVADIDAAEAAQRVERARERLSAAETEDEGVAAAERELRTAEAMLDAAGGG